MNRSSTFRARTGYLAAVGLLVLGGFLIRATSLDSQSLWRDEVDALRFATVPWSEMVRTFTRPGWNGPLYFLLLRGWIAIAGTSEYAMRFFSLIPGVLAVPLIYALGRRRFHPRTGLIAALLVASSPYLVWYSQEVKMYALVLALSLVATYSLHRGLEGDGWRWWLAQIAATTIAFYSHILAALFIPAQILLCIVRWREARKRWQGVLASFTVLIVPYLPLLAWQAPLALDTRETGFHSYALGQMIVILLKSWSAGIAGWGNPWGAAMLSLLAAGGLLSGLSLSLPVANYEEQGGGRGGIADRLELLIWLAGPLLAVWVISLRQPLFTDRYLIWSAPAFYLLAALALDHFADAGDWSRWVVAPLLAAILVLNGVNVWKQATTAIKSDFRAAAAYVVSYEEPAVPFEHQATASDQVFKSYLPIVKAKHAGFKGLIIFQIPYGRYAFDYYFPIETYPWVEGLYTNHKTSTGEYRMSEQQASWQMREKIRGYEEVWLIATEVGLWDERNLVEGWLDEHLERVTEAHFARIDVYKYVRPDA